MLLDRGIAQRDAGIYILDEDHEVNSTKAEAVAERYHKAYGACEKNRLPHHDFVDLVTNAAHTGKILQTAGWGCDRCRQ
jgi:hypothetical protein